MIDWSCFVWIIPTVFSLPFNLPTSRKPFCSPYVVMAPPLLLHLLLLLLLSPQVCLGGSVHGNSNSSADGPKGSCSDKVKCHPGILLPVWLPQNPSLAMQAMRAVIYFSCLLYMFLGVSIIADRFMSAIETITSQVWQKIYIYIYFLYKIYIRERKIRIYIYRYTIFCMFLK